MRTSVSLDSIGALIEGRHSNPFEVLGPHEVVDNGRRALAVRAFLPNTRQVWVVDPSHAAPRPGDAANSSRRALRSDLPRTG